MEQALTQKDREAVLRRLKERTRCLECEDALHRVCAYGWLDVAEALINKYDLDPNTGDFWGSKLKPIHAAARAGQTDVVKFLVTKGAWAESEDTHGNTALHYAYQEGHWETAWYLVTKLHCNIIKKNVAGDIPLLIGLERAVSLDNRSAFSQLLQLYESSEHSITISYVVLQQMKKKDWSEELVKLVKLDKLKSKSGNHDPIVITTSSNGDTELFEFLVNHTDVDVDAIDVNGNNALMLAMQYEHWTTAKSIIQCASNLTNVTNHKGEGPVRFAARGGNIELLKHLVQQGCNPDEPDRDGNTPLLSALRQNHREVVEYLVKELKCDLGHKNNSGNTPFSSELISALYRKATEHALWLFALNLSANESGKASLLIPENALEVACKHMLIPVVKVLIQKYHCDPLRSSIATGLSVFHGVFQRQDLEIAKILLAHKTCNRKLIHNDMSDNVVLHSLLETAQHPHVCHARSPVKIFVLGNPLSGKSSLVQAFVEGANHEPLLGSLRKVSKPKTSTAGIFPIKLQHRDMGSVIFYDCASHSRYIPSHVAVIENLVSHFPAIFLVVVDVNQSKEEIAKELSYWAHFVNSVTNNSPGQSHLIIAGSHSDRSSMNPWGFQNCCVSWINDDINSVVFGGGTMLDCRKLLSRGIATLGSLLSQSCAAIRVNNPAELQFEHLALYTYSLDYLPMSFTLLELSSSIAAAENPLLPQSEEQQLHSLKLLHNKGLIVFLEDTTDLNNSYIASDPAVLLHNALGVLFAPEGFKQHHPLNTSIGLIPAYHLEQLFRDTPMILAFLKQFSLCLESTDKENIFIPGLVSLEEPEIYTTGLETPNDGYRFGWVSSFTDEYPQLHFVIPFLHILQMEVIKKFVNSEEDDTDTVQNPVYHIWKNGIHWIDKNGVEGVLELQEQNRKLLLLLACPQGKEMKVVRLRSEILDLISTLQSRFCKLVLHHLADSIIAPQNLLEYPIQDVLKLFKCSVYDICNSILVGNEGLEFKQENSLGASATISVDLHDLLIFESYMTIPPNTSIQLLKLVVSDDTTLPSQVIEEVASSIGKSTSPDIIGQEILGLNPDVIAQISEDPQRSPTEISLDLFNVWSSSSAVIPQQLKDVLDQFSIFGHRKYPLVSLIFL